MSNLTDYSIRKDETFSSLVVDENLSVGGLIDPSGLVLDEQAVRPFDPTSQDKGLLWVQSGAPNTLIYTDDAGTDTNLLALGASVDLTTDVTGTLPVANGGTGATTLTDGGIVLGSGTGAVTVTAQPTDGQFLIGSSGSDPVLATLTAGTGIGIVNGAGSVTISNTVTGLPAMTYATYALIVQQNDSVWMVPADSPATSTPTKTDYNGASSSLGGTNNEDVHFALTSGQSYKISVEGNVSLMTAGPNTLGWRLVDEATKSTIVATALGGAVDIAPADGDVNWSISFIADISSTEDYVLQLQNDTADPGCQYANVRIRVERIA